MCFRKKFDYHTRLGEGFSSRIDESETLGTTRDRERTFSRRQILNGIRWIGNNPWFHDRDGVIDEKRQCAHARMVLEIITDWQIFDNSDSEIFQMLSWPNTREHQQLRRIQSSGAQKNFFPHFHEIPKRGGFQYILVIPCVSRFCIPIRVKFYYGASP